MLDLYNNKYDRKTLKDNIYALKLIDILKTQTLDVTNYTTPFVNSISGITICGGTAFSVTPVDAK